MPDTPFVLPRRSTRRSFLDRGLRLGLSVTGIAGPAGGTPEKPVGLVFLGLADAQGVQSKRLDLGSLHQRDFLQLRAAKSALNWARLALLER